MSHDIPATGTAPDDPPEQMETPLSQMGWLADRFVERVPGVTRILLGTSDGLLLLQSSNMGKDTADSVAANISSQFSLGCGIPGPDDQLLPPTQILMERPDCLLFVIVAGRGHAAAFSHHPEEHRGGMVDTVLGVFADPDAEPGVIAYEMGLLIKQFAHIMQTPVRRGEHGVTAAGASDTP
ncbi:roadblock/LC7 domain-containing protein [Streptomyces antimycoticus]|uniref:roadblock/LC7 domain-containing protein n=1 Tax=Streptomyces antimycoticus TaxID=68175 RepID=UPI0034429358